VPNELAQGKRATHSEHRRHELLRKPLAYLSLQTLSAAVAVQLPSVLGLGRNNMYPPNTLPADLKPELLIF
jgi:hypothetical protein